MKLTVDIEPFYELACDGHATIKLRIQVVSESGEVFTREEVQPKDFLRSEFDMIFDSAKQEIKQYLEEKQIVAEKV